LIEAKEDTIKTTVNVNTFVWMNNRVDINYNKYYDLK